MSVKTDPAEHVYTAIRRDQRLIWSVARLWELAKELPVREISMQEFSGVLDADLWFGERQRPTTRAVVAHAKKIFEARLRFPIILDQEGNVMDGMHRLAKAYYLGNTTVKVVQFASTPSPDRVEDL
jgi:hypothetical protein